MERSCLLPALLIAFFSGSLVGASLTGELAGGLSSLLKWTPISSTKTPLTEDSLLQFESGYLVETIAEGNKLGVTPHAIRVSPEGELIAVDSVNSNIVRITPPLSAYSRARLVAGSFEGLTGHADGKPSDARFRHPKGVAMDGKGNIYVADTSNLAIRKIGESGVTTIAGGKSNAAGYRDGPSEDARFSGDFDVIYVGSICSLLVVDRGNAALRQIFLQDDDCDRQYSSIASSDIMMVVGAVLVGYVACLIQHGCAASLFAKKAGTLQKLKDEKEEAWSSCRRVFSDCRRFFSEINTNLVIPGKSKMPKEMAEPKRGRTPLLKQKSSSAGGSGGAADLKQQKNLKAAPPRDPLGPAKHRRRQEFAEFYGLTARQPEVNSVDRKFDHVQGRSNYVGLDSRHQSRVGQRGD